ncbi:MAG TPA: amidase family protein, partial [Acidimicrobiia bacterium]|nr:amidase family protein [Acidimicrobiia bacterium]
RTADPMAMYLSDVCTIPTNLTGACAISVPAGLDGAGLPVGVQVLAPALGEAVLFRAARALEAGFAFTARPALGEEVV